MVGNIDMAITDSITDYWKLDGSSFDSVNFSSGADTAIVYSTGNGKINQGAGCNGTTSFIQLSAINNPSITINVWVKTTSTGISSQGIFGRSDTNSDLLQVDSVTGQLRIRWQVVTGTYPGTPNNLVTSLGVLDTNWHMLTATYDVVTGVKNLYIDGVLNVTQTVSGNTSMCNTSAWTIGNIGTLGRFFSGAIDEVGVWSRALVQSDIDFLYNNGSGRQFTIWNKLAKAAGTTWTKVKKTSTIPLIGGSPIGMLLALTYAGNQGTFWTKFSKASGTTWTKITKAV